MVMMPLDSRIDLAIVISLIVSMAQGPKDIIYDKILLRFVSNFQPSSSKLIVCMYLQ